MQNRSTIRAVPLNTLLLMLNESCGACLILFRTHCVPSRCSDLCNIFHYALQTRSLFYAVCLSSIPRVVKYGNWVLLNYDFVTNVLFNFGSTRLRFNFIQLDIFSCSQFLISSLCFTLSVIVEPFNCFANSGGGPTNFSIS
jgi:hypothetical protein